jgi:hypothetical protein
MTKFTMKTNHRTLAALLLSAAILFAHSLIAATGDVKCYDTVKSLSSETQPGDDSCQVLLNCIGKTCTYTTYSGTCKRCVTSKTETHQKLQSSSDSGTVATTHSAPCVNDGAGCGDCDWTNANPDSSSSTYCKECVFTSSGCL